MHNALTHVVYDHVSTLSPEISALEINFSTNVLILGKFLNLSEP